MLRDFAFLLFVGSASLATSCVFDATGGRKDTAASTGSGGGVGASSTTGTSTSSTASGGPGGGAMCGDGIVEAPETCETGDIAFTSCVDCSIPNLCHNQTIDPGEACDETSANCTNCEVTGGACAGVDALPFGLAPLPATSATALTIPGSFGDPKPCASSGMRAVKVFRYDVGPYPSGLYVSATGDGQPGSLNNAVLWAYRGCSSTVLQCNDVDPDPLAGGPTNTAVLALPLQAPGSVIFVAVGDSGPGVGGFHFVATPTRLIADFEGSNDSFTLAGGWTSSSSFVSVTSPATEATLESPDIDVVGIDNMSIALDQVLSAGANATLSVIPDGGAPLATIAVPDTSGMRAGIAVHTSLPKGTKSAKIRFILGSGNNGPQWEIHRLLVGPA